MIMPKIYCYSFEEARLRSVCLQYQTGNSLIASAETIDMCAIRLGPE